MKKMIIYVGITVVAVLGVVKGAGFVRDEMWHIPTAQEVGQAVASELASFNGSLSVRKYLRSNSYGDNSWGGGGPAHSRDANAGILPGYLQEAYAVGGFQQARYNMLESGDLMDGMVGVLPSHKGHDFGDKPDSGHGPYDSHDGPGETPPVITVASLESNCASLPPYRLMGQTCSDLASAAMAKLKVDILATGLLQSFTEVAQANEESQATFTFWVVMLCFGVVICALSYMLGVSYGRNNPLPVTDDVARPVDGPNGSPVAG